MDIHKQKVESASGIKFTAQEDGRAIGRAFLYILKNDLHKEPFGFLEDVFVQEDYRGRGIGKSLVRSAISEARALGCYKLICTSRTEKPQVHKFYETLGFKDCGKEFRIDFV